MSFSNAAVAQKRPSGAPQNKGVRALLQVTAAPQTIEEPLRRKHNTDPRVGTMSSPKGTPSSSKSVWNSGRLSGFQRSRFQRAIVKNPTNGEEERQQSNLRGRAAWPHG